MSGMDEQKEQEEAVPPVAVASSSFLDYDAAVAALYSDTHQATTRDAIRAAGARRHRTVDDMHEYMRRLGLLSLMITDENNNNNNNMWKNKRLIHITGTKGKGSTAAMCECICRRGSNHAKVAQAGGGGGWTTGLFTSPHLMDIRERIRINGKPVAKQIFAQAYWTIRRRLENYKPKTSCNAATTKDEYDDSNDDNLPILPGYFRMLSLLAMFIFTHHQEPVIDVIILEVGLGGRYDATNVLDLDLFHTSACGVTLIDYDHCRILGHSLEEIAWEKGGIFQVVKKQQPQNESTSTTTTTTTSTTPRPVPAKDSSTPSIATTHESQEKADSQRRQLDHKERNRTTTTNERVFYSMDRNTDAVLDVLRACAFNEGRGGRLVAVSSSSSHRQWNSRNGKDDDMDKSSTANTHTTTTTTTARRHPPPLVLGLHGEHQWDNAALAVALCKHVMNRNDDDEDADNEMYQALVHVSWPGRCQTIHHDKHNYMSFFVDGAHTVQSIKAGLEWFQQQQQQQQQKQQQQQQQQQIATAQAETSNSSHECSRPRRRLRALIFNCSHEREPVQLLHLLLRGGGGGDDCHGLKQHHDDVSGTDHGSSFGFDVVLFCRSNTDRPSSVDKANAIDLLKAAGYPGQEQDAVSMTETGRTWQDTLLTVWKYLVQLELIQQQATSTGSTTMAAAAAAHITESNLTALEALRRLEGIMADKNNQEFSRLDVFVTGSLYLAGSMLEALEWTEMSQTEGSLAIPLAGD
jgi:folylpolyglutamate synthase/dihydrofolate synthase